MFTAAPEAADITTRHARYPARLASSGEPDQLSLALQQRLTEAEVQLALTFRGQNPAGDDLLVVDGPLRDAVSPPNSVEDGPDQPERCVLLPRAQPIPHPNPLSLSDNMQ